MLHVRLIFAIKYFLLTYTIQCGVYIIYNEVLSECLILVVCALPFFSFSHVSLDNMSFIKHEVRQLACTGLHSR